MSESRANSDPVRPGRGQATAQEHVFTRCTTRANVAAAQVKKLRSRKCASSDEFYVILLFFVLVYQLIQVSSLLQLSLTIPGFILVSRGRGTCSGPSPALARAAQGYVFVSHICFLGEASVTISLATNTDCCHPALFVISNPSSAFPCKPCIC